MTASIRIALHSEVNRIRAVYQQWGYGGGVTPHDVVFLAERDGEIVGIVRETEEHGVLLLRGMQVSPGEQRRGVGSLLLRAFMGRLNGRECYCVPYTHLIDFYARSGFERDPEDLAPGFLQERLAKYRNEGRSVLLMRRPASRPETR